MHQPTPNPAPAATPSRRGLAVRRTALALGAAVVVGSAGLAVMAAVGEGAPAKASAPRREGMQGTPDLASVTKTSFDIATNATGELEARNQIEIRSKLEKSSTISEITPEGTRVKAGDVLVKLNADSIQTELDQELLQVESSKAELVAAENSYEIQVNENESKQRQALLKLELAELSLQQWLEGEVQKERQKNKLALDKAVREQDRLAEKFERSVNLYAQGFLSKDELERDRLADIEAEAAVKTALLDHEIYESFQFPKDEKTKLSDVEEARAELERVKRQNEIELVSKDAARVNRRRQLALRETRLAKLQEQFDSATMKAPSAGMVVYSTSLDRMRYGFGGDGPLQIGRQVHPNELLVVLPDTSEMVASVKVHETLAAKIRPGQPATLKVDAAGGASFMGKVESIGVLAEGGGWRDPNLREYAVKIALVDNGDEGAALKPSMRCEAQIVLGRVEDVLTVPVQAVFNSGPVRYAYLPQGSKYVRVPVKVGKRSDTHAEIAAGLELGQRVLVREPLAGEIIDDGWDSEQLALVGLKLGDDGQPIAMEPPAGPGGRPGRGAAPGAAPTAVKTEPATDVAAPEATPAAPAAPAPISTGS